MNYSMFTGFMSNIDSLGFEAAADYAKNCGFSGVEFFFMARHPEEIPDVDSAKKYKKLLEERGIATPCVSVGVSLVRNNNPEEIVDLDGAIKALEFTAAIGAKLFHHTLIMSIKNNDLCGLEYDKIYPLVLQGAKIIAKRAEELGITVLYEPQGKFFNGYEGLGRFYRDMKQAHKNVGICCDLGNSFWVAEEPCKIFEEFKEDIKHVHLKDYYITDAPMNEKSEQDLKGKKYISEAVIGEGVVDISRIVKLLKSVNYNGFLSIEDRVNIQSPELISSIMSQITRKFSDS